MEIGNPKKVVTITPLYTPIPQPRVVEPEPERELVPVRRREEVPA